MYANQIREDVVEAVARAICMSCEENPDHRGDARGNEFRWQDYRDTALAAISAFTAAQQQGQTTPPSTPVRVKTLSEFMAEQEVLHPGIHDKVQAAADELRARLAQQPAAVDEEYPTPRNRAEAVALARLARAYLGVIEAHIDAAVARCETDLGTKQQEPTTCKHDFRRDEDHGGACCQLCGEVRQ